MLTGESLPVDKQIGDAVAGATVNTSGVLTIRATAIGSETALAQIVKLVENAQTGKSGAQRLADRISAVFVPVVMSISLLTFLGWTVIGGSVSDGVYAAVAVLIIACPCALGSGHADGDHGRHRPRRAARHPHQVGRGARTHPTDHHGRVRQDRHPHRGRDVGHRRASPPAA